MLNHTESSTIGLFTLLLAALRDQQGRLAAHPNMTAIIGQMRAMMRAIIDLLDDEELDELILRFPPEMELIYPTAPYLSMRA